jgi:hypothetical protein
MEAAIFRKSLTGSNISESFLACGDVKNLRFAPEEKLALVRRPSNIQSEVNVPSPIPTAESQV